MRTYAIVIVENDEDEQVFMRQAFTEDKRFNVLEMVANGEELFDWLEKNKDQLPDLILSDLNMPGKNGYDIITEVRETPHLAHIPVVITSTSSAQLVIDKSLKLGAMHYCVKPETFIDYGPFAEQLHKYLEKNLQDKA